MPEKHEAEEPHFGGGQESFPRQRGCSCGKKGKSADKGEGGMFLTERTGSAKTLIQAAVGHT